MSGIAAAIRLAMFDKKVVLLEKHSISGGLNSYYHRRIRETKEIINFDVGLHALTNFAKKGDKRKPFIKLLKQLRIPYESFQLDEQSHSLIKFKSAELKFSNDLALLQSEIHAVFPNEIDGFNKFVDYIKDYNEVDLDSVYLSSKLVLNKFFQEELLKEMIIAPLLIYGSAWEDDMDFSQFVIMFKSLYFEGFSRPKGGVRTIINLLLEKLESVGGEVRFRTEVKEIRSGGKVKGVVLKNDEYLETDKIFSSIGLPETFGLLSETTKFQPEVGKLSFTETIYMLPDKKLINAFDSTIVFYNDSDKYLYRKPNDFCDFNSAVFCLPDNYNQNDNKGYGTVRVTHMANYQLWNNLERKIYLLEKEKVFNQAFDLGHKLLGHGEDIIFKDVFTPKTITKYTSHFDGTVYGSTTKLRNGLTEIEGLHIIGTDQGFLGIVGSILSGISIANLHGLME